MAARLPKPEPLALAESSGRRPCSAALRDLFHHGIVGWDTADRQDAAPVGETLSPFRV